MGFLLSAAIVSHLLKVVPEVGLEPTHLAVLDFESSASTISPLGRRRTF
jgi:hypothetical protein